MFGEGSNLNAHEVWSRQSKYKYDPFSDTLSVGALQIQVWITRRWL